jgi:hypothetical protein
VRDIKDAVKSRCPSTWTANKENVQNAQPTETQPTETQPAETQPTKPRKISLKKVEERGAGLQSFPTAVAGCLLILGQKRMFFVVSKKKLSHPHSQNYSIL